MKKLTLIGAAYNIECIGGLTFLIPSRLRSWERRIRTNLRKIVRKLKTAGYYDYVISADMVTVILSSNPNEQLAFVYTPARSEHRPVLFMNSGGLMELGTTWNASVFAHEATHVFQEYYLSASESKKREVTEKDASRTQIKFLKRCKSAQRARDMENGLRQKRKHWEWLDSAPINEEERNDVERVNYSLDILTALMRHILI